MSETARTPLKPRDIRRRAYRLMKQCWVTLLIAAVLMSLFDWIDSAVENHGEKMALNVYNARMATFYAENEPPAEEAVAALDAMLAGQGNPEVTDDIEYASLYDTREWLAQYDAADLYDKAFLPWKLLGIGIGLLDAIFTCIIAVGLCHGLLSALRGGENTPHCLLLGWPRAGTASWMSIQAALRILGWTLLPMLVSLSLSYVLGDWFEVIGQILILLVALWATLHYALAEVHLADDCTGSSTASECLRCSVDDANFFGVWQIFKVLWPEILLLLPYFIVFAAILFFPAAAAFATIIDILFTLLISAFQYACYVCIYEEIRQRVSSASDHAGLARARALSQA